MASRAETFQSHMQEKRTPKAGSQERAPLGRIIGYIQERKQGEKESRENEIKTLQAAVNFLSGTDPDQQETVASIVDIADKVKDIDGDIPPVKTPVVLYKRPIRLPQDQDDIVS